MLVRVEEITLLEGEVEILHQGNVHWSFLCEGESSDVGDLVITNNRILWKSTKTLGWAVVWDDVILHALVADGSPQLRDDPCVFLQLDIEDEDLSEVLLVHNDSAVLQGIYDAAAKAQEMNPNTYNEEGDEDDDWITQ